MYRTPGKAELIGGRIVELMATGDIPDLIAGNIFAELRGHAKKVGHGRAHTGNMGFAVPELSTGRESFSPDASWYAGPWKVSMNFIEGAPTLAVEVRSASDYGQPAEEAMAQKRAEYFEAGTLVVWDVDPRAECVHVFRTKDPIMPTTYRRGQITEAEPAVPGWTMSVDEVFWLP